MDFFLYLLLHCFIVNAPLTDIRVALRAWITCSLSAIVSYLKIKFKCIVTIKHYKRKFITNFNRLQQKKEVLNLTCMFDAID